jgi:hypothetical protein
LLYEIKLCWISFPIIESNSNTTYQLIQNFGKNFLSKSLSFLKASIACISYLHVDTSVMQNLSWFLD